jgi:CDP-2,3-bis-(O-geranylgeranyl)-sn-glycerol synthase
MTPVDVIVIMLAGIWLFLPAMLPNSAAALMGGGKPMDFGKTWRGKRILGDGKTWRGFFGGAFSGVLLGLVLIEIAAALGDPNNCWGFGPFWSNLGVVVCLAFGSLIGDMCGAFIKRRLGMQRGQKAPGLDQYDFVAGALLITALFNWNFIYSNYIEGWHIAALIFLLVVMFGIHRLFNIIGYKQGIKKEPW